MRTLAIALTFLLVGFFSGYLLLRNSVHSQMPSRNATVPIGPSTGQNQPDPGLWAKFVNPTADMRFSYQDVAAQSTVFGKLHLAYQLAANADARQLEKYLDLAIVSKDPLYNYNLVSIFLERYTALDPNTAISFIQNNPKFNRDTFLSHIVTSWVRHDPEAAIDYFANIRDQQLRYTLGSRLLADPTLRQSGLLAEVEKVLGPYSDLLVEQSRISQLNPEQAFDDALGKFGQKRTLQLRAAVTRWAKMDPVTTLARINDLSNASERRTLLQIALTQYARTDPLAAVNYVQLNEPDNLNLEQQVLSIYAQYDVEAALPLVEEYVQRTGNYRVLSSVLSSWVQKEPAKALAYAETIDSLHKTQAFQSMAFSYVNSHPEEGMAWVLGLDDSYQSIKASVLRNINPYTVDVAERAITSIEDPKLREQLLTNVAQQKAKDNPQFALDWLDGYQKEPGYNSALQSILTTWSWQNAPEAAKEIESRLDDDISGPIVGQIAQNWYRTEPAEALSWLDSLPASELKFNAIAATSALVAQRDPSAALAMLSNLPDDQLRHNAQRTIAFAWAAKEPDRIEEIITTLQLNSQDAARLRNIRRRDPARG